MLFVIHWALVVVFATVLHWFVFKCLLDLDYWLTFYISFDIREFSRRFEKQFFAAFDVVCVKNFCEKNILRRKQKRISFSSWLRLSCSKLRQQETFVWLVKVASVPYIGKVSVWNYKLAQKFEHNMSEKNHKNFFLHFSCWWILIHSALQTIEFKESNARVVLNLISHKNQHSNCWWTIISVKINFHSVMGFKNLRLKIIGFQK